MSDFDLVKRLRDAAADDYFGPADVGLLREAASRIEHLESMAGAVSHGQDWLSIRKEAGRKAERTLFPDRKDRDG